MKKILFSTVMLSAFLGLGICSAIATTLDDYQFEIVDLNYKKEYKAALEKANEAIKQYPDDPELYLQRGIALEELNSKQSAMVNYNKAIQLNPKYEDAYLMRGLLKLNLNSPQGAYTDFTTCITVNSKNGHCYLSRGAARVELGDLNGSIRDMETGQVLLEEEMRNLENETNKLLNDIQEEKNKINSTITD